MHCFFDDPTHSAMKLRDEWGTAIHPFSEKERKEGHGDVEARRGNELTHGLNCGVGPLAGLGEAPHEVGDAQLIGFYVHVVGCPVAAILTHH